MTMYNSILIMTAPVLHIIGLNPKLLNPKSNRGARALTDANLALRREVAVRSHCLRVQEFRVVPG